jgi:hypothetical protein
VEHRFTWVLAQPALLCFLHEPANKARRWIQCALSYRDVHRICLCRSHVVARWCHCALMRLIITSHLVAKLHGGEAPCVLVLVAFWVTKGVRVVPTVWVCPHLSACVPP